MAQSIQTKAAYKKLQQKVREMQKDLAKDVKALSKGIYIAASNANIKKGKGTPPKPGSKKASNGDWQKGRELTVTYYTHKQKKVVPVTEWLEKLNRKSMYATYKDKNGKPRKRKVSKYKIIPFGNQHEPLQLFEHEYWRKGAKGNLPYSWGGEGLADYYLRRNWRTEETDKGVVVRISPARFKGEKDGERVLRLLEEGGRQYGSKQLVGFWFIFANLNSGRTGIYAVREYGEKRPIVTIKGYHIKRNLCIRLNRILKRIRASKITNQQWRQIGRGS